MKPEERLNFIFDLAERKLGIPKLLEASDLLSGTDARADQGST